MVGLPARRDDFRAEMERDLDRRHPDAARARVDENAFALAQIRATFCSACHEVMKTTGKRGRLLESQIGRNAPHVAGARQRVRGEAKDGEAEHTIARSDVRDIRSRPP